MVLHDRVAIDDRRAPQHGTRVDDRTGSHEGASADLDVIANDRGGMDDAAQGQPAPLDLSGDAKPLAVVADAEQDVTHPGEILGSERLSSAEHLGPGKRLTATLGVHFIDKTDDFPDLAAARRIRDDRSVARRAPNDRGQALSSRLSDIHEGRRIRLGPLGPFNQDCNIKRVHSCPP